MVTTVAAIRLSNPMAVMGLTFSSRLKPKTFVAKLG
jgi:hypothetical protein